MVSKSPLDMVKICGLWSAFTASWTVSVASMFVAMIALDSYGYHRKLILGQNERTGRRRDGIGVGNRLVAARERIPVDDFARRADACTAAGFADGKARHGRRA